MMRKFPQVLVNVPVREKRDLDEVPSVQSAVASVERALGAFEAQRRAKGFTSFTRAAKHAANGDANSSQSLKMRSADKAQSNDRCGLFH